MRVNIRENIMWLTTGKHNSWFLIQSILLLFFRQKIQRKKHTKSHLGVCRVELNKYRRLPFFGYSTHADILPQKHMSFFGFSFHFKILLVILFQHSLIDISIFISLLDLLDVGTIFIFDRCWSWYSLVTKKIKF